MCPQDWIVYHVTMAYGRALWLHIGIIQWPVGAHQSETANILRVATERLRSIPIPRNVAEIEAWCLVYLIVSILHATASSRIVQSGLAERPMGLVLRMKIWRGRPENCLPSRFAWAVLWLTFIPVNAHLRGLG